MKTHGTPIVNHFKNKRKTTKTDPDGITRPLLDIYAQWNTQPCMIYQTYMMFTMSFLPRPPSIILKHLLKKLANIWNIGLETAKETLRVTTHRGIRSTSLPIKQRFCMRQSQLQYNQLGGCHCRFYTNTMFSSTPSINGCDMAQIYVNDIGFRQIYPMRLKSQAYETLSSFIHNIRIPSSIHSNDAKELMHGKFKETCQDYHIPTTYSEPYSPWQNWAENGIKEFKRHVQRKMKANNVLNKL
jgi:hypothetical protein